MNTNSTTKSSHRRAWTLAAGISLSLGISAPLSAAELIIEIKPVKETAGQMMIAVYNSADSFRKKPLRALSQPATPGAMKIRVDDLPVGDYAVMLYQDINDNSKLDSNLVGMPTEPWGASLQGKAVFGAPKWTDTRFKVIDTGTAIAIELN